jgi:hypothetical protein
MKWWKAMLGSGKIPALAMVAAGLAVSLSLAADEPVHFSDSDAKPVPGRQPKKVHTDSPLESLIGRGGTSLDALTASPFQPVETAAPRVLTPKEQERLSRERNWMFRDSADYGVTDKTAREAFGVRSQDWKSSSPEPKRSRGDSISRYVETSRAADRAAMEAALLSRNATLGDGAQASRVGGQRVTGLASARSNDRSPDVESAMRSSDGSGEDNSLLNRFRRATLGGGRSRGSLDALSSGSLQSGGDDQRDLLGGLRNPMADSLAGLRGIADPMSTFLDKTKEPLNPVLPVGAPSSALRPAFGTMPNDLALRIGTLRGGVGNGLNASGISSSSDSPGQLSAPLPSQIQTAPLVLDPARRPF